MSFQQLTRKAHGPGEVPAGATCASGDAGGPSRSRVILHGIDTMRRGDPDTVQFAVRQVGSRRSTRTARRTRNPQGQAELGGTGPVRR
jgi:hypothetical protein